MKKNCHNCKYLYSCGYTGCLSGRYECSQKNSFKPADGKFWSLKKQKEVSKEMAKKHWLEKSCFGIVKDKK